MEMYKRIKRLTYVKYVCVGLPTLTLMLLFSGCAGYRGYVLIREKATDKVTVRDKGIINKKPIFGKGVDFWANKECDFEYSIDKDGKKTYKFSSKKDSIWSKIWGSWKMIKPNSVEIGK